mmetsp:Transcript_67525/g.188416  ORF Transcript_67525/g.188416 Transcript_67525/m.188416 type:complete len:385 (-) Transcript_67525:227-1381(-)
MWRPAAAAATTRSGGANPRNATLEELGSGQQPLGIVLRSRAVYPMLQHCLQFPSAEVKSPFQDVRSLEEMARGRKFYDVDGEARPLPMPTALRVEIPAKSFRHAHDPEERAQREKHVIHAASPQGHLLWETWTPCVGLNHEHSIAPRPRHSPQRLRARRHRAEETTSAQSDPRPAWEFNTRLASSRRVVVAFGVATLPEVPLNLPDNGGRQSQRPVDHALVSDARFFEPTEGGLHHLQDRGQGIDKRQHQLARQRRAAPQSRPFAPQRRRACCAVGRHTHGVRCTCGAAGWWCAEGLDDSGQRVKNVPQPRLSGVHPEHGQEQLKVVRAGVHQRRDDRLGRQVRLPEGAQVEPRLHHRDRSQHLPSFACLDSGEESPQLGRHAG